MIIANNETYAKAGKFLALKHKLSIDNIKEMHKLAADICEDIINSHNICAEGYTISSNGGQLELSLYANTPNTFHLNGLDKNINIGEVIKDFLERKPTIPADNYSPEITNYREAEEEEEYDDEEIEDDDDDDEDDDEDTEPDF